MLKRKTVSAFGLMMLLSMLCWACTSESYDTGDGSLSYMCADFVEAKTDNEALLSSATTDDGTEIIFQPKVKADWIKTKDSVYRALLYYNKVEDKTTTKAIAVKQVLVPKVLGKYKAAASTVTYPEDPVTFEAAWMSANRRYINLSLYIKIGSKDGKIGTQSLGMLHYETVELQSGAKLYRLKLLHDQNKVPEYYSTQVYISIPMYRLPFELAAGDKVEIGVNTYKGFVSREFDVE